MGQSDYRLEALADDELLAGLWSIVGRRNQITAEFLAYLAELDQRQLFLDLGFSSLFQYCVEALRLCESTAGRHIAAARVCRHHPQVFGMVANGDLHASALSLLRKHLTAENAGELFELCKRRSARKVEELLAARFPRPDVRDSVRRLPARGALTLDVGCLTKNAPAEPSRREPSGELQKTSFEAPTPDSVGGLQKATGGTPMRDSLGELQKTSTETPTADSFGAPERQKSRRLEPLSADRYGVHFTADGEFRELLERVRGLAGHRLPSGDLLTLLKLALQAYESKLSKERFGLGRQPRRSRGVAAEPNVDEPNVDEPNVDEPDVDEPELPKREAGGTRSASSNPKRRRHCPAAVARAVFERDGKQCSYVSPGGRRCNARWCLELDHVDPWAVGGEDTIENLRLRCRAHNQRYARLYFGQSRVDAAVRHSRQRRVTAGRSGKAD